jgi:hypothetical protein
MDELVQEIPLNTAGLAAAEAWTPNPLMLTVGRPPALTSLSTVTCPIAFPALDGLNCTRKLYVEPAATVTGNALGPAN